jgi:4,5:9,10-diseco-3-hydroxy-5,9,17-trioxoandrosta-1(10),2-diene-4-oate hydrolase
MIAEKSARVEGLNVRYLESGSGPALLFLHGASLGSSADVWVPNLPAFDAHGFRAIALDQPGFGLTDNPADHSIAYRRHFVMTFMDELGLQHASVIGHSQSGRIAVELGFMLPGRVAKVVVLATGSLLPPLKEGGKSREEGEEGEATEPTLEQTRRDLEANLFQPALITPAALETRHKMSLGKNFHAFLARSRMPREEGGGPPLWQRLAELPAPLLMLYGKQDRGRAAERSELAKQRYPGLDLQLLDRCKHLLQWDAAERFAAIAGRFLAG